MRDFESWGAVYKLLWLTLPLEKKINYFKESKKVFFLFDHSILIKNEEFFKKIKNFQLKNHQIIFNITPVGRGKFKSIYKNFLENNCNKSEIVYLS